MFYQMLKVVALRAQMIDLIWRGAGVNTFAFSVPIFEYTVTFKRDHHGLPLHCVSSHNLTQFCLSHLSERLRGSSICSVIAEIAESSTIRTSALFASASPSPFLTTGLTRYCRNKLARTATNST